ncbi:MAG: threonine synthase [Cyclobacteriaceae bacterium]|nr:threonine synthase [Cyclobacteriaceae bacterium]
MQFYSTNKKVEPVSFKEAVLKGLPDDNGLFMPGTIPQFSKQFVEQLPHLSFEEIAMEGARNIIEGEIPEADLLMIIRDAFDFDIPIKRVHDRIHVLELFHGPTLAFKDFGARFMALVMGYFLKSDHREVNILVATSGDTGSAVAQGFLGVDGVKVTLLYPKGKVSKIQEQQLTTIGRNVTALEVEGTFDDCQHLVKTAFLDEELNAAMNLSSANSINIARLLPQSFYYTFAYSRFAKNAKNIVFSVPSGNLGNLCGGLLASKMGIPIAGFISASNANDIVPHYLHTGHFDPKPSVQTISNAMDVGNPSNFVRMLHLYENDFEKIKSEISGISFDDRQTEDLIREVHSNHGYLMCPHTAIAYGGLKHLLKPDDTGVFLSTAHPSKFKDVVEPLISSEIEIPLRLREIIEKEKQALAMSKDFADFKAFLLDANR